MAVEQSISCLLNCTLFWTCRFARVLRVSHGVLPLLLSIVSITILVVL